MQGEKGEMITFGRCENPKPRRALKQPSKEHPLHRPPCLSITCRVLRGASSGAVKSGPLGGSAGGACGREWKNSSAPGLRLTCLVNHDERAQ